MTAWHAFSEPQRRKRRVCTCLTNFDGVPAERLWGAMWLQLVLAMVVKSYIKWLANIICVHIVLGPGCRNAHIFTWFLDMFGKRYIKPDKICNGIDIPG